MRIQIKGALAALCFTAAITGPISGCSSSSSTAVTNTGDGGGTPDPDAGGAEDGGADTAVAAPFKLTSTAYAEGATIPADNACTSHGGGNKSPPLAWGPGPEGTKSYAIIFRDDTISFLHSIVYDIPVATNELPANVAKSYTLATPAGAKQTKSYLGPFGYAGPCAPSGTHSYEQVLHALDVATLPGATMTTTMADAEALIEKHSIKSTKLTGTYKKL